MKIYTKTGDKGETSLVYGVRVSKADMLVEAYGTCDEANSFIGLALSHMDPINSQQIKEICDVFKKVQTDLFHVGAELATPKDKEVKWKIAKSDIDYLEEIIDMWDKEVPPLTNFILPGGHVAGATFHTARTIVRRAERRAVAIGENVNPHVVAYLNRLSDLLFVTARYVNLLLGRDEQLLHS